MNKPEKVESKVLDLEYIRGFNQCLARWEVYHKEIVEGIRIQRTMWQNTANELQAKLPNLKEILSIIHKVEEGGHYDTTDIAEAIDKRLR